MKKKFLAISLTLAVAISVMGCSQGKPVDNTTAESLVSESGTDDSTEETSDNTEKKKDEASDDTEKTLDELKAEGKTYYYSQDGVIDSGYFITEDFEIITEDGKTYFDFTPDEMIENANAIIAKKANDPLPYSKVTAKELGISDTENDYTYYSNDLGMLVLVKTNSDNDKIEHIIIGATSSVAPDKSSPLSTIAIQSAFIVCAIDPNMIPQYAAISMVDVAAAGMITYSEDAYAYSTEIGQVGYGVLKLNNMVFDEDLYAIAVVPLDKPAE